MGKSNGKTMGLIAMVIVVTIYGVSYISRAVISEHLPTTVILGIQMAVMTILFTGYNLITRKNMKLNKKDLPLIIASGLFGTSFFHGLTILSVTSIGATVSSLLFGFAAVFALIVEFAMFGRKKTKLGILSIIVSLVGVYILMGVKFSDLASTNFKGYALCLLSIVSWVVYCFMADRISEGYEKTVVLNYQALVGALTTIPFLFIYPIALSTCAKPAVFMNLIVLGVFNSTFAYFLNMFAIKKIGVTLSNLMMDFLPVVTILISLVLYGTIPTANQIIGGGIILASVFMLDRDQRNLDGEKVEKLVCEQ